MISTRALGNGILCLAILVATVGGTAVAKRLGQYSGFENHEAELGAAVATAIRKASPDGNSLHDFSGREPMLGRGVATLIKTLNHNESYQHETNDALVKMTLEYIEFAKQHDMLAQIVEQDLTTQAKNLERVRKKIEETGNKDLALVGIFEQTTCFFQLVDTTTRAPNRISYRSPFGNVLNGPMGTRAFGIHDLTEAEIHEVWTKPRYLGYAKILGVDMTVSDLGPDGMITVEVR